MCKKLSGGVKPRAAPQVRYAVSMEQSTAGL